MFAAVCCVFDKTETYAEIYISGVDKTVIMMLERAGYYQDASCGTARALIRGQKIDPVVLAMGA